MNIPAVDASSIIQDELFNRANLKTLYEIENELLTHFPFLSQTDIKRLNAHEGAVKYYRELVKELKAFTSNQRIFNWLVHDLYGMLSIENGSCMQLNDVPVHVFADLLKLVLSDKITGLLSMFVCFIFYLIRLSIIRLIWKRIAKNTFNQDF